MDAVVLSTITEFFSHYPVKQIKKEQIIIHAGNEPRGVYHIVSGKIKQYDINYRGDEVVVNVFASPAFFPMSWTINKTENRYFFEAMTDVEVRIAPADDAVTFLKSHPDVMYDLLRRLYSGVDGIQRRMAHLMGGSARSRVIFELFIECSRFGTKNDDESYTLSINESDLAKNSGLTRETTNRELAKLKQAGYISHDGKHMTIKNINQLQSALGDTL